MTSFSFTQLAGIQKPYDLCDISLNVTLDDIFELDEDTSIWFTEG